MNEAKYKIIKQNNSTYIYCSGKWVVTAIDKIEKELINFTPTTKKVYIDLKDVNKLDSSGALLIVLIKHLYLKSKKDVELVNINNKYKRLLEIVEKNFELEPLQLKKKRQFLAEIGKKIVDFFKYIDNFLSFLGELFIKFIYLFINPKNFRIKETIYFIQSSGINALPIIGLTSFLVGVVIAYQTIVQLNKFGADIFVVDASSISIARELGPMITAIVVAGRSASSYTAEIGAMKLTEEIDAMKTMGFAPFYFLVIPRVVALMISLPILIFFSDIIGILGSMIVTKAQIGLSFEIFINRLYEVLALKHYVIGIIKGPFFAIIIALVGVFHGLKVSKNTESIGKETTNSVVNAIFLVIVCDAIFSIIFTELGL